MTTAIPLAQLRKPFLLGLAGTASGLMGKAVFPGQSTNEQMAHVKSSSSFMPTVPNKHLGRVP